MAEPLAKHDDDLSEKLEGQNEVDGHEKKSYLHRLKDKAIRLKDKVKKNMKGHGEEKAEEESGEEQDQTPRKSDDSMETNKDPNEKEEIETDVGNLSVTETGAEAMTENAEVTLGFGGGREQQDKGQEEKPMSSQLKDNSMEEFSSVKDHVDSKPKPEELLGQWESEGDQAQEKLGGFGFHGGSNSIEKEEEESSSRVRTNQRDGEGGEEEETPNFNEVVKSEETHNFTEDNSIEEFSSVKDHVDSKPKPEDNSMEEFSSVKNHVDSKPRPEDNSMEEFSSVKDQVDSRPKPEDNSMEEFSSVKDHVDSRPKPEDNSMEEFSSVKDHVGSKPEPEELLGQWKSEGDQTQEKLEGFAFHGGSNSIEKQEEESPSRVWKTQRDGKGGEEEETPNFTDEIKSEGTPNFTEEVKSGGSGIGSGGTTKESGLVQGPKDIVPSDESVKDNEEKLGGFGFHGGSNSNEKQEESPSRVWKTQRDDGEGGEEEETPIFTEEVKSEKAPNFTEEVESEKTPSFAEDKSEETPNFAEEVNSGDSGGMTKESGLVQGPKDIVASDESIKDNEEEKLGGFGFHGDSNSIEKQEESPSRVWKTQRDGEGGEEEETPIFTEEVKSEETPNFTEVKSEGTPNFTEEVKSGGSGLGSAGMTKESGLVQGQKDFASDESSKDNEEEKLGGFGFHGGSNSIEKQEEESPSRVWKTQRDGEGGEEEKTPIFTEEVKSEETPSFTEVKSEGTSKFIEEVKSGGSGIGSAGMTKESGLVQGRKDFASDESSKDNEEEILGGFGFHGGSNSNEKQEEESPSRVWKTQRDGEGGEEEETPIFTEEVKSEETPNFTEVKSEGTPNFTEEVKSGGSGIGSAGMTKESGLVQGQKDFASDESSKDNEEEKLGGFGFHGGSNSIEKQEEESPSRVWKTQRDGEGGEEEKTPIFTEEVKSEETPSFTEVKSEGTSKFIEEVKSGGSGIGSAGMTKESGLVQGRKDFASDESSKDNEEEILGGFGFHGGSNSNEKQEEESPSRVWKTQRDGEGGEEEETPNFTEEVKSEEEPYFSEVKSEETPYFTEVKSEETPNFTEEVKSGGSGGITEESGLVQGQKDVAFDESRKDNEEEKSGGSGFHGGSYSIEKQEESPRRVWKTQRDGEGVEEEEAPNFTEEVKSEEEPNLSEVKSEETPNFTEVKSEEETNFTGVKSEETPNFTEEVKSGGSGIGSGGMTKESGLVQGLKNVVASDESIKDNEEEKLGGFGFDGGSNSIEKQEEESPSRVWKTQRDGEDGEKEETPNYTGVKSEETPSFAEEVKSGGSGIGSGGMTKESGLVQGPKDVVASDESIKDNADDTIGEEECKGTQKKQNEEEEKGAQSYGEKLLAAKNSIASMFGYGV